MPYREMPGSLAPPAGAGLRHLAAAALRLASAVLARLAAQLVARHVPVEPLADPVLEFYAEAGAPEGALYVDGHLIGRLPGVKRL